MSIRTMPKHRARQRGAALLMAMIIVTLVATLAAAMVWQQWRAVQVESSERARAQATWVLSGALDFARLILREDWITNRPTMLTEPWATPLAESRLSTFLATDKANPDDGPEAFLSGSITDAESRYNLNNLGSGDPIETETLSRLCESLRVDSSVATRIATGLRQSTAAVTGATPLKPVTVAQLAWLGVDPASIETLKPYVMLLPEITPVNVNTASKEVLAAVLDVDPGTADRLVQMRQATPFKDMTAVSAQMGGASMPAATRVGVVRSTYFEVQGQLRLDDHVLVERSLLYRTPNGQLVLKFQERVSSLEQAGG
jgi:general secretion pathway protein K